MSISNQTDFYLNLQQFAELKSGARAYSSEATKAVAEQFESLFVQQMLGAMRSAVTVDENQRSSYVDFYQDMYDKQLALTISQQGGLGIAKVLMQQLPGGKDNAANMGKDLPVYQLQETKTEFPLKVMNYQAKNSAVVVNKLGEDDFVEAGLVENTQTRPDQWARASRFVQDVWPHAEQASKALGVSPEVLVAQSALETGWGKHAMQFPDGKPSNNLFGIKAGKDWNGPTLAKATLEFRDGVMQTEVAQFRAYDSIAQSLSDYVNLIQSKSRYQGALQHQGNDANYVRGLQQAGYATDPEYADKIMNIMQSVFTPEVLVAQSALETGWGKHAMQFPDGKPSNNLFGIKAGKDWNGPTLAKATLEFRDGVMQTEVAQFRAYDSIAQSLSDYVNLIQSKSRYQGALQHQGNDANYVRGLQQAGYATDPEYADKIMNIMQSERFQKTLALLPSNQNLPLTGGNRNA